MERDTGEIALASIVMPVYNAAAFIEEAVSSVLSQTYKSIELIIVDDGSDDGTSEILGKLRDPRVRCIRQDNSGGPSGPRNAAIAESSGEYIFFFDADDVMDPEKISKTLECWRLNQKAGLIFTEFSVIDENGRVSSRELRSGYPEFYSLIQRLRIGDCGTIPRRDAYRTLLKENFIGTSGVAVRRKVLSKVGGFDESLNCSEDRDLWFRVAREFDLCFCREPLHYYRVSATGQMSRGEMINGPQKIRVLKRQLKLGLDRAGRADAKNWIGRILSSMAYESRETGDLERARKLYKEALQQEIRWSYIRGWLSAIPMTRAVWRWLIGED